MSEDQNPIVGHKTLSDGRGGFRHEPLRQIEAEAIMESVRKADRRRKELMPDEVAAVRMLSEAQYRLKELGWREAIYCPKDGSEFDVIEPGSTGIHRCHYEGEWPNGHWWISDADDTYPSRPLLFRLLPNTERSGAERPTGAPCCATETKTERT